MKPIIIGVYIVLNTLNLMSLLAQHAKPEIKNDSIIYRLYVDYKDVTITDKEVKAIAINNSIPAPTLHFEEGKWAIIHVTNNMSHEETSIHWHGLILPNFQDGVPYLTTPPIKPKQTFTYKFPLKHSGTYWYHSHTGLQEQQGLYGGIVISPKQNDVVYDHDLVIVLSDWTNENPNSILKNLKRHNEYYGIKIGNAPSLMQALFAGTLGSQLKLWAMKMPGMHISDIYYDAVLANGEKIQYYPQFKPKEKIRIRLINAAASTYFWITYADNRTFTIVSVDGVDIEPINKTKILMAIAETYDIIIEIPEKQQVELRATTQDVTHHTSIFLGNGETIHASDIDRPNYQQLGVKMAKLHSGGHQHHNQKGDEVGNIIHNTTPKETKHQHHTPMHNTIMDTSKTEVMDMNHKMHNETKHQHHTPMHNTIMDTSKTEVMDMNHKMHKETKHQHHTPMQNMTMWDVGYNYNSIRSKHSTKLDEKHPIRNLIFNLTGNMWRYTWSINNKPLSESDKIKINRNEIVRITLNNQTMMHHPMHLHGHFFRVLNGQKDHAPLKHTVDVPPMSSVTIEFEANATHDWFFHCHVLYHMMAGMSRVFSYGDPRNSKLRAFPYQKIKSHDQKWFTWSESNIASHMIDTKVTLSNTYNQLNIMGEYGWNTNYEFNIDYEGFVEEYTRLFIGMRAENEHNENNKHDIAIRAGIKYLLWYVLDTEISLDHYIRPEIELSLHLPLTQRIMIVSHYELQFNFGLRKEIHNQKKWAYENTWNIGIEYILGKYISFMGSYDNRYGMGGGLKIRM